MTFFVDHARNVHPSRRGVWFIHEHSARLVAMAMTPERWSESNKLRARDVLKRVSGPRWGVFASQPEGL